MVHITIMMLNSVYQQYTSTVC